MAVINFPTEVNTNEAVSYLIIAAPEPWEMFPRTSRLGDIV